MKGRTASFQKLNSNNCANVLGHETLGENAETSFGDQEETSLTFPTIPSFANFPRAAPLGIENVPRVSSSPSVSISLAIQTTSSLQVFVRPTLPDVRRLDADRAELKGVDEYGW